MYSENAASNVGTTFDRQLIVALNLVSQSDILQVVVEGTFSQFFKPADSLAQVVQASLDRFVVAHR